MIIITIRQTQSLPSWSCVVLPRIFLNDQRGNRYSNWQHWAQYVPSAPVCCAFSVAPGPLSVSLSPSFWKAGLWSRVMVRAQCASSVAHIWNVSSWNGGRSQGFSRKQTGYSPSRYFPPFLSNLTVLGFLGWPTLVWLHGTIYIGLGTQTHMYKGTDGWKKNLREKSIGN